jgi:hypothetical protein
MATGRLNNNHLKFTASDSTYNSITTGSNKITFASNDGFVQLKGIKNADADNDAVNYKQMSDAIDAKALGLAWKLPSKYATTTNLSSVYSSGTLTAEAVGFLSLDGFDNTSTPASAKPTVNDRVLVKDQTNKKNNGFYKITNVGAADAKWAMDRSSDADEASELIGVAVFVERGTENGDCAYVQTADSPITIGTTNLEFAKFATTQQTNFTGGVQRSGNNVSLKLDASTVVVNGEGELSIKPTDSIVQEMLVDNVIGAAELQDGTITDDKVSANSLTSTSIAAGGISNNSLAANSVHEGNILDSAITTGKINPFAVNNGKIADDSINTRVVLDGAITTNKLDGYAVSNAKLADNAVDTRNLQDGKITDAKLAAATIQSRRLDDSCVLAQHISNGSVGNSKLATLTSLHVSGPVSAASFTASSSTDPDAAQFTLAKSTTVDAKYTLALDVPSSWGTTVIGDGISFTYDDQVSMAALWFVSPGVEINGNSGTSVKARVRVKFWADSTSKATSFTTNQTPDRNYEFKPTNQDSITKLPIAFSCMCGDGTKRIADIKVELRRIGSDSVKLPAETASQMTALLVSDDSAIQTYSYDGSSWS